MLTLKLTKSPGRKFFRLIVMFDAQVFFTKRSHKFFLSKLNFIIGLNFVGEYSILEYI